MLVTVIGRGHSGTRLMSQTLSASGVFMGSPLNRAGDLLPPEDMYEACLVVARYVEHRGGPDWDFSRLHAGPVDPAFGRLIESYLASVLASPEPRRGWKIPETTLCYPWIVRMFPEAHYIHWLRDPRDGILGFHVTDDLTRFGIPSDPTDDLLTRRAISWCYQRAIVKSTPPPQYTMCVRYEDFVFRQQTQLIRLGAFLGFPLTRVDVATDRVGRWRTDGIPEGPLALLHDDLVELGYLLPMAGDVKMGG